MRVVRFMVYSSFFSLGLVTSLAVRDYNFLNPLKKQKMCITDYFQDRESKDLVPKDLQQYIIGRHLNKKEGNN